MGKQQIHHLTTILTILSLTCFSSLVHASDVYTLYRNSPIDENMRIHIATFDAYESSPEYNFGNCRIVRDAMINRPHITIEYWCEKGRFKE
jgi:hypothetical protein